MMKTLQAGRSAENTVARLQAAIDGALAPVRDTLGEAPYAILDFPDHANVGDSAIWLGEVRWFETRLGRPPAYVARHAVDWGALRRAVGDGIVFLHGGGNFGDVWPGYQAFREDALARLDGVRVVQLPQSIQYRDAGGIDATARAIARHGRTTLLVRDTHSEEIARRRFDCAVSLCPDMAFCLGTLFSGPADVEEIALLRTDSEAGRNGNEGSPSAVRVDWLEDDPGLDRRARWRTRLGAIRALEPAELGRGRREYRHMNILAQERLDRGLRLLSRGRRVLTDRLHGHILCTLLGKPHTVIDNNYGKISRFIETHGTDWDGVTLVPSETRLAAAARP